MRVLELGGYAAAYAGRLLAAEGEDVVKLHPPEAMLACPSAWSSDAAMAWHLDRGKRSVQDGDGKLLGRLADRADAVICEAPTADALDALGFDDWRAPIKIALTPFGRTGPKRNWRAAPITLLAMGGHTVLSGDPERQPLSLPGHYLEFQAGALAYVGLAAASLAKRGETLDISLYEVALSLTQFSLCRYQCLGDDRSRHGNAYGYIAPIDAYQCLDGWVYINIVPTFWDAFVVFLDQPELLLDERFSTNDLRCEHLAELTDIVQGRLESLTREEVMHRADEARIPAGLVMSFDEVLSDPQHQARQVWQSPDGCGLRLARVPFDFGDPASDGPSAAVALAEHAPW